MARSLPRESAPTLESPEPGSSWSWSRPVGLLAPVLALVLLCELTGILEGIDQQAVRARVDALGWLGPFAFMVLYGLGILLQVPVYIFVGAGVVAFGPFVASILSYIATLCANLGFFGLVRALTRSLGRPKHLGARSSYGPARHLVERIRRSRLWSQLKERPFLVVVSIRTFTPANPIVTLAFALSEVPFGPYLLGSMLAIGPQLLFTVAAFAWALGGNP